MTTQISDAALFEVIAELLTEERKNTKALLSDALNDVSPDRMQRILFRKELQDAERAIAEYAHTMLNRRGCAPERAHIANPTLKKGLG